MCQFDAVQMKYYPEYSEERSYVDQEKCLGCGLCATICESEAISMHLREDRAEPFERWVDLGMAILDGKKANA